MLNEANKEFFSYLEAIEFENKLMKNGYRTRIKEVGKGKGRSSKWRVYYWLDDEFKINNNDLLKTSGQIKRIK